MDEPVCGTMKRLSNSARRPSAGRGTRASGSAGPVRSLLVGKASPAAFDARWFLRRKNRIKSGPELRSANAPRSDRRQAPGSSARHAIDLPDVPGEGDDVRSGPDELERGRP